MSRVSNADRKDVLFTCADLRHFCPLLPFGSSDIVEVEVEARARYSISFAKLKVQL